jgi:acyl carrier protein
MATSAVTREVIEQFVVDALVEFGADRTAISPEATFNDLEIDSLDMVELGQSVKREFGIELKPKDFEEVAGVRDALSIIYAKAGL